MHITDLAVYVPGYRVPARLAASVWGTKGGKTATAIANHDEDVVTMAAQAALSLEASDSIGSLFFATTTAPMGEKGSAPVIAKILDLPSSLLAVDLGRSLRSGSTGLQLALAGGHAARAGAALVLAADQRKSEPGSALDQQFGDAGAAVLVSDQDPLLEVKGTYCSTEEFTDVWRPAGSQSLVAGDSKFILDYGYVRMTVEAVKSALAQFRVSIGDLARVVTYAPDPGVQRKIARQLRLRDDQVSGERTFSSIGDAGCAAPFVMLAEALETAKPGDRILLVGFGAGCDVYLLQATDKVRTWQQKRPLARQLEQARDLDSYGKYLRYREMVSYEKVEPFTSLVEMWREQDAILSLKAPKCRKCGAIQYPPRRVCWQCKATDDMEVHRLARKGTVVTFNADYLVPTPNPPVWMAAADLADGGRFFSQVVDVRGDELKIGAGVELCLRKVHSANGLPHYFWKFKVVSS